MPFSPTPEKLQQFAALYIANGFNAVKAARAMGYKKETAQSNAYIFQKLAKVSMSDALRAIGLDEVSQAKKLEKLREAKLVKWNPGEDQWDAFEDGRLQMDATKEINRILGAYPAEPSAAPAMTVNVIVDVDL